jgi:hypothetical protein
MDHKRVEQEVAELVETARPTPPMPPERRTQALAAMEAAGRRPRRTWIWRLSPAAATVVITVIVALIGSPARSARHTIAQVRDQVLAAADKAETVHIYAATPWYVVGVPEQAPETVEADTELWADRDGFSRLEVRRRDDGHLLSVDLYHGMERLSYLPGLSRAHRYWEPEEASVSQGRIQRRVEMQIRRDFLLIGGPEEYQYAAVNNQGPVDVLEVGSLAQRSDRRYDLARGEKLRLRAEVDRQTGRLLSWTVFTLNLRDNTWEVKSESRYEWNVPIPDELRTLEIPEGTAENRYHWWDTRADQVLAQQQTENWTVTVHALDVNQSGAVYVSLSAAPTPNSSAAHSDLSVVAVSVEAVDDQGVVYQQEAEDHGSGRSYLMPTISFPVVLLKPTADATGRVLTITVHPYMAEGQGLEPVTPDEPVVFELPLPSRQDGDNLPLEATEFVQH